MKLNGTHKFKASSTQVFNAILNPEVLKSCIPGCNSVEYLSANSIRANITTPLPGLKGPYGVVINIANRQEPNHLELQVQRKGTGGSINAVSQINLKDEADGALLSYDANADLEGPIAIANNPLGQGITKNSLGTFFKNLDKAIAG
ncbi:MAG TPA: SRPBCC domain-containing protein [Ktedonobacteraceae bacterium]|nr:SRPBCC domain-containing protein [Ktedonobacteraceae bacterium]